MTAAPRRRGWRLAAIAIVVLGALLVTGSLAAASDPPVPPASTRTSPPACRVADVLAKLRSTSDWSRTLLDWTWKLPRTTVPPHLVPVSRAGLSGGGRVRSELIPDLRAMARAARAAGARLAVESAYRSYSTQVSTFSYWVSRFGYRTALVGSARAGHSEHQLGTVLDFKSYGGGQPWAIRGFNWGTTKAGRWLAKNAWRYGFVMSYPSNRKATVCYGYEPWHFRYFGKTIALAIHDSGLAPRTWLWRHGNSPGPAPTPTPEPSPAATPTPAPTDAPTPAPTPSPEVPTPSPEVPGPPA